MSRATYDIKTSEFPDNRKSKYHGAHLWFSWELVDDLRESEAKCMPIKAERLHLNVRYPGRDTVCKMMSEHDVKDLNNANPRFEQDVLKAYKAFVANEEPPTTGVPLSEWTEISRSLAERLKHMGIKTVEDLANMPDDIRKKIGPDSTFCKRAEDYLKRAAGEVKVSTLQATVRKQEKQIADLEATLTRLSVQFEAQVGASVYESSGSSH